MYTVIGGVASRAFRVLWMLEELGAAYEHQPAKPRSDEVRAHNPSGKIPVLLDAGNALSDSSAILTYLADTHEALTYPAGSIERARQDAFTFAILDDIDSVLWTAARHSFILPEAERVPAVKGSLKLEYSRNIAGLMDRMAGPFLMGDMMTVPDIILTHCGNWAVSAKFPEPEPRFEEYLAQTRARPAYGRTRALRQSE